MTKTTNPTKMLLKNVFSNWASMLVALAIAFFMSPFLVHNLGKEVYGIWALVLSVAAYSHFLDAGMKQSLARFIPKYYATRDFKGLNEILNSSNLIYSITGSITLIATLLAALFLTGAFKVTPELMEVMQLTLVIIGVNEALRFYFLTASALGPFHRYDIGNAIDISVSIINALAIVIFISRGFGIITLAVITLATAFAKYIVRWIYQKKIVPEIKYKFALASKACMKELLSYGIVSFFIVMAWMIIIGSDNVIIGIYLTTTDITYYSIAGMMINHLRTLVNAIGIPLVPAISHLDTTSDAGEIAILYHKISRYLYYLCAGICMIIMFFGGNFIYLWMGDDFSVTVKVLSILIIPASLYLPQVMANSVLLGTSKHKALLYILAGEAISKITLSILLIPHYGIYGLAWGTIIPQLLIYLFIYPYVFHRIIDASLGRFYKNSGAMIFTAILLIAPLGYLLDRYLPIENWFGFLLNVSILSTILVLGFWWRVLEADDKARITKKLPQPLQNWLS